MFTLIEPQWRGSRYKGTPVGYGYMISRLREEFKTMTLGRRNVAVSLLFALVGISFSLTAQSLSESDIGRAVGYGKQFNTRADLLRDGLKRKKFKIAGAFSKDGTSKYVTFYNDLDVISGMVAEANQK